MGREEERGMHSVRGRMSGRGIQAEAQVVVEEEKVVMHEGAAAAAGEETRRIKMSHIVGIGVMRAFMRRVGIMRSRM